MAYFGSNSVTFTYDDGPGGTGRDVTPWLTEIGGIKVEALQGRTDAFGDIWEETTPTGLMKMEDLTLGGQWDTTATTGPHVVFVAPDDGPQDGTRTLVVVFGDSKTMTVETRLISYEVKGVNGDLTQFEAVLRPTGSAVWS